MATLSQVKIEAGKIYSIYLDRFLAKDGIIVKVDEEREKRHKAQSLPREYVDRMKSIIRNNMKIKVVKGRLIITIPALVDFLEGRVKGFEDMKYMDTGTAPRKDMFFFKVEHQRIFKSIVERKKRKKLQNLTDVNETNRSRRRETSPEKRFEILKGDRGDGILARWDAFSNKAKRILKAIYGGKPKHYRGVKGLDIKHRLLNWLDNRKNRQLNNALLRNKIIAEFLGQEDALKLDQRLKDHISQALQKKVDSVLRS